MRLSRAEDLMPGCGNTMPDLSDLVPLQGFSWTEIYFAHFVQAAILFGHLGIFKTFF